MKNSVADGQLPELLLTKCNTVTVVAQPPNNGTRCLDPKLGKPYQLDPKPYMILLACQQGDNSV